MENEIFAVNDQGHCRFCGREYDDVANAPCPSDDCPAHWEELGLEYDERAENGGNYDI